MAIISRMTNNESGRRSFKLSPLEMLILGLILVVVFYLISLWVTGAFEAPKQAAPTAAPAQLLDRALAATERAQARQLTIEKKLAALEDQLDKAGSSAKGKGKNIVVSPQLNSRLDALEKKVGALDKASGAAQPGPQVDLTPLEARLVFLEKKVGEKPNDESVDQRLKKLDQRLKQVSKAPAPSAAPSENMKKLDQRLSALEERTGKIGKAQDRPVATPADLNKLAQRLDKLEERNAQIAKQQDKPVASANDLKKLDERLANLGQRVERMAEAPAKPAAQPAAVKNLEQRLAALEKKASSGGVSKISVPQDIDDRLRKLESTVKKVEPSEAHTSASLADLETRLQNLERSTPRAGAAAGVAAASLALMETRLHKIEVTLNQTSESLRKVRAPVADPELIGRLDRLEKSKGEAKRSDDKAQDGRVRKMDKRLAEVDKRLAELVKAQALTSRHLAQVMEDVKDAPKARTSTRNEKTEKKPEGRAEKPPPKTRMITHTVRSGQTLFGLARRYGVKVGDLRRWNPKIQKRNNLWVNEDLIIYVTR